MLYTCISIRNILFPFVRVLTLLVAPGDAASLPTAPGPILGQEESSTVILPPIGCCGQEGRCKEIEQSGTHSGCHQYTVRTCISASEERTTSS